MCVVSAYTCDSGWMLYDDHCFYFNDTGMTYENAKKYCTDTLGAHPVRIDDEGEQAFVSSEYTLLEPS